MKRIYTFGHEQVERNLTVGDIIENKANDVKMTQVTAQNAQEAEILADQDIDMIITGSDWYETTWIDGVKYSEIPTCFTCS